MVYVTSCGAATRTRSVMGRIVLPCRYPSRPSIISSPGVLPSAMMKTMSTVPAAWLLVATTSPMAALYALAWYRYPSSGPAVE